MTIPSDTEIRYPLGSNGYNHWLYSNGRMHSNYGLFSPFLKSIEGMEEKHGFFLGLYDSNMQYKPYSLLPNMDEDDDNIERFTFFSPHQVYYVTVHDIFYSFIRVFIDENQVTYFSIYIENKTEMTLISYLSYYLNTYLRHSLNEGGEDKWFRKSSISKNGFVIETNEDLNRTISLTNKGYIDSKIYEKEYIKNEYSTTSRRDFLNGAKTIFRSKSLKSGFFEQSPANTWFKDIGIASKLSHIHIPPFCSIDSSVQFSFIKSETISKEPIIVDIPTVDKLIKSYIDSDNITSNRLSIECISNIPELENFDNFFKHLMKQVEFCSSITGYVQLSELSLIGIRDIFQALEAYLYWNPGFVRVKILEALDYIFINGRCPRQYSIPNIEGENPAMDTRLFIDQGVWVISTIVTYLKVTGDLSILNEDSGYYVLENNSTWYKSKERDSVLEHLFRILEFLTSNLCNETFCIYALYGDWNDALDGLGVSDDINKDYGTGVSIMTTLQVYQNLSEMIDLLETNYKGEFKTKLLLYKKYRNLIKGALISNGIVKNGDLYRILHGWGDKRSYFIGSFKDSDNRERDGLTSNAFWILSGLLKVKPELESTILNSFERLDSKYGYKTF